MRKDRVIIRLADIPQEGRDYNYDRETGEFDLALRDLIDSNPYQIDFFIRPAGNVYEVTGTVKTSLTRVCSKCGYDVTITVNTKIHEILFPKIEDTKGDTQSKSGFLSRNADENLEVTYITNGMLNAEDMIHEIIALSDPAFPTCGKDRCDNIDEIERKLTELQKEAELALQSKGSAFDVLKNLKLEN